MCPRQRVINDGGMSGGVDSKAETRWQLGLGRERWGGIPMRKTEVYSFAFPCFALVKELLHCPNSLPVTEEGIEGARKRIAGGGREEWAVGVEGDARRHHM